jgi:hypothetical protein
MISCSGEHDDVAPIDIDFGKGSVARRYIKNIHWGLLDTTTTNTGKYSGCHAVLRRQMYERKTFVQLEPKVRSDSSWLRRSAPSASKGRP